MSKILLVIDMQKDFIDGALGTKEAVAIVPNVAKKIDNALASGVKVLFTQDTHQKDYMDSKEGQYLPVVHCVEGTDGWKICKELEPYANEENTIRKPNFGFKDWNKVLGSDVDEIELIGLCTDICVVSNALILKSQYPDSTIKVDGSCCAGVTPESHDAALVTMKMCQVEC